MVDYPKGDSTTIKELKALICEDSGYKAQSEKYRIEAMD